MAFLSPSKITTMEHARKHRTWALWIMVIVYIFNFIDRQIVNILQEDIKADLGLLDWQLGTMTGLTFAIVYCTFGIPVARIADSTSRKGVMAVSLAIWSGFTALCGLATTQQTEHKPWPSLKTHRARWSANCAVRTCLVLTEHPAPNV